MYIGFWKRFGAYWIDYFILFAVNIVFIIVWIFIGGLLEIQLSALKLNEDTVANIVGGTGVTMIFAIQWLYYALFESSKLRATLGKLAIQAVVVDKNGMRITFLRASVRYWCKIISILTIFIGFIMAGFTPKKQALHDMISGTYVKSNRES